MALIICSECKKEFSDKAGACPHCGCPLDAAPSAPKVGEAKKTESSSVKQGLIGCLGLLFVVGAIGSFMDKGNKTGSTGSTGTSTAGRLAPKARSISVPLRQYRFLKTVKSFYGPYQNARNELKKSALRNRRGKAVRAVLQGRVVRGWVGILTDMSTTGQGKAHVSIKLWGGKNIYVKTWNNEFSDISDKTLIRSGTPLYKSISNLSKGSFVVFSGRFVSNSRDYIRESSMTESGSMTEPEYLMRFSSISRYVPPKPRPRKRKRVRRVKKRK